MNTIRLIAVDLDGTLLTSRKEPSVEGVRLLRQAAQQGIQVVIATARRVEYTRDLCRSLGIHSPMICLGGAAVWASPDGPVWYSSEIPCDIARQIARYADERGWELCITIGPMTYYRQRSGQPLGLIGPNRMVFASNTDAVHHAAQDEKIVRILAWNSEAIQGLQNLCGEKYPDIFRVDIFYNTDGSPESISLFPNGLDKGAALRMVMNRLGIAPEEALAIGDNTIDLGMFAVVGCSVAMGNAPAEVKASASLVAPNNDHEGVAWALRQMVFDGA